MTEPSAQATGVVFREEQHYATVFLVVALGVLALVGVLMAVDAVRATAAGEGGVEASIGILLGAALAVGLPLAFVFSRLVTEVTIVGVSVRLAPWQRRGRTIRWADVARFAAVTYRPLRDYGGWGLRGTRRHAARNARGHRGVFIQMADGATFLIGSQVPFDLENAIASACGRPPIRSGSGLARAEGKDLVA